MSGWAAIAVTAAGCYLLKLAGLVAPRSLLDAPRMRRLVEALPVAVLAALVATQTVATGTRLVVDARMAGLAVAGLLVVARAPFLVVVAGAAVTAAVIRAV